MAIKTTWMYNFQIRIMVPSKVRPWCLPREIKHHIMTTLPKILRLIQTNFHLVPRKHSTLDCNYRTKSLLSRPLRWKSWWSLVNLKAMVMFLPMSSKENGSLFQLRNPLSVKAERGMWHHFLCRVDNPHGNKTTWRLLWALACNKTPVPTKLRLKP